MPQLLLLFQTRYHVCIQGRMRHIVIPMSIVVALENTAKTVLVLDKGGNAVHDEATVRNGPAACLFRVNVEKPGKMCLHMLVIKAEVELIEVKSVMVTTQTGEELVEAVNYSSSVWHLVLFQLAPFTVMRQVLAQPGG